MAADRRAGAGGARGRRSRGGAARDGAHAHRFARDEGPAPGRDGRPAGERGRLRPHAGRGRGAETQLVCGSFRFERRDAHPLVELLPPLIHLRPAETPAAEWLEATLRFLAWETREAKPGTETIVSRLTDVIFVLVLRAWIESVPEGRGGWMGALRERHVGAALAHIHRSPERDWTNASLAEAVGMSRSRFAARFTALVGEPPLTYLSRWRLETAAGLLQDGTLGLGEIASRVGYESEAAFSKAFRRRFGAPPGAYRRSAAA